MKKNLSEMIYNTVSKFLANFSWNFLLLFKDSREVKYQDYLVTNHE